MKIVTVFFFLVTLTPYIFLNYTRYSFKSSTGLHQGDYILALKMCRCAVIHTEIVYNKSTSKDGFF